MKFLLKTAILFLGFAFLTGVSVDAQNKRKQVTVNITIESPDGYRTNIDTTFVVNSEAEADRIIDRLVKARSAERDQMEKVVIIRDRDDQKVYAQSQPKPRKKSKAMMGVYLDTNSGGKGVRITSVTRGGAAEEAGMRRGDLILEIDGDEVNSYQALVRAKEDYEPGERMRVIYLRDGDRYSTTLRLRGEAKPSAPTVYNKPKPQSGGDAFLGVYPEELSASRARDLGLTSQQGVYLEGVVKYSGAERGGLKKGDVILAIEGRPLDSSYDLGDALDEQRPGDVITISYLRDGRYCSTEVTLTDKQTVEKRKPQKVKVKTQKAFLGVHLENQSGGGVRITGVVDNSAAEEAGLERGDVILSLGRYSTDTYGDLSSAMKKFEPNERIRVVFERDGRTRSTSVELGAKTVEKWVEVKQDQDKEDFYFDNQDRDRDRDRTRYERDRDRYEDEIEVLLNNIRDRDKGLQIASYMRNPSLKMDLFEYYPNPNNGRFTLRFVPRSRGDLQIRIFNSEGQEVYLEFIQDFYGEYNKEVNISRNAPRGVYFLQLTQGERGMVKRLVVK